MAARIGQHLLLGSTRRVLKATPSHRKQRGLTTSCQLPAGIENLFPDEQDPRVFMLENVGLSYVLLDGDRHSANRFYLEDLAIGLMRPPINVDIER